MESNTLQSTSTIYVPIAPREIPQQQQQQRPGHFVIPTDCWQHTPPGADVAHDEDAVLMRLRLDDFFSCSSEYPTTFEKMVLKKRGSHMWVVGFSEKFD